MRCPDTICRESLNPKVQGSIPCASTNMLCLRRPTIYMLGSFCRDASYSQHLTASFDSFASPPPFASALPSPDARTAPDCRNPFLRTSSLDVVAAGQLVRVRA
jgi:hypothetical protein